MIRRGGKSTPPLTVPARGGVERDLHDLATYSAAAITERWGYARDYWVSFFIVDPATKRKQPIGILKRLTLADPREGAASVRAPSPEPSRATSSVDTAAALDHMQRLLGMVDQRTSPAIEAESRRAQHTVEVIRDLAKDFASTARANDEALRTELAAARKECADLRARHDRDRARWEEERRDMEEQIDDPDPDSEPASSPRKPAAGGATPEQYASAIIKAYNGEGTGAAIELLGTRVMTEVVKILPILAAKAPALMAQIQGFMGSIVGAPAAPAPVVQHVEVPKPRRHAPRRIRVDEVDARPVPPIPPPSKAPPDEFTTEVVS
jgi:flagellar motility protein MotE (MotC chaperone)